MDVSTTWFVRVTTTSFPSAEQDTLVYCPAEPTGVHVAPESLERYSWPPLDTAYWYWPVDEIATDVHDALGLRNV